MNDNLKRYLLKIKENCASVDARGVMQVSRIVELPLDEVFVNLTVQLGGWGSRIQQSQSIQVDDSEKPEALRDIRESGLSLDHLWRRNELWTLLGDPGSGKTTILKHLALEHSKEILNPIPDNNLKHLPILVTLRFFVQAWIDNNWKPEEAILSYLAGPGMIELGLEEISNELIKLFKDKLSNKRVLLLFDGLDEQRDADMKRKTVTAIEELLRKYPGNRCIVASRIIGYNEAPLSGGFNIATLEPFNDEQRSLFFNQWLYAIEKRDEGYADAATKRRAEQNAKDLIDQVNGNDRIKALASNPLLCTIIALIHRQGGGTLPSRRAELYKLCVDTFIFNWEMHKRRKRSDQDSLNPEETQEVLKTIALYFQEKCPKNLASRREILDETKQFLINEWKLSINEANSKAENLVNLIRDVAGLLIDRGNEEYGFFHLTFQEYLAARAITRHRDKIEGYLCKHLFDPRWREVICLAAINEGLTRKGDGTAFIKAIQDCPPHEREDVMHYAFRMAFLCATETPIEPETADGLVQRWVKFYCEHRYLQELLLHLIQHPGARIFYWPSTLQPLREMLNTNAPPEDRFSATQALGALLFRATQAKDSEILSELRKRLEHDDNAGVRGVAAQALGAWLQDREILPVLRKALKLENEDNWVRAKAIEALTALQDREALPDLREVLNKKMGDAGVLGRAAEALGMLKDQNNAALDALCNALGNEDRWVADRAAYALGMLKETARPYFQKKLESDACDIKAAHALGVLRDTQGLSALRQKLDENPNISEEVRFKAAHALGLLREKEPIALKILSEALKDETANFRKHLDAIIALRTLRDPKACEVLVEAFKTKETRVRGIAAEALGTLQDISPPQNYAVLSALRKALIGQEKDKDKWVRDRVAQALGMLQQNTGEVSSVLCEALEQDESESVRYSAAYALGLLKASEALPNLTKILCEDRNNWVRGSAAQALGMLQKKETLPTLLERLEKEPDIWVRFRVAEAIEQIDMGSRL